MKTQVKFLRENATFQKAHSTDSGFDLTACGYEYKGNGLWHILLGVAVMPPTGFYFEVMPRSSFSKTPFMFANNIGIIDQDYRGEWRFPVRYLGIPVWNDIELQIAEHNYNRTVHARINEYLINKRIAQAILIKYHTSEIEIVNELPETERDANGFGSTGE